ncbi:MAG: SDR family NAD(P)-dependent oxidoreductase [Thermodesulfobacteriota bacterium]
MNQVVVITGLAQGMGRETAIILARQGHSVAGFDVDSDGLASLREELARTGGDHFLAVLDITDRPGLLGFRDQVLAQYGRVDTVVSNVGLGFFGAFEEINLESALKCFEINVIGAAALFQAFLPWMRQNRRGRIVCMSSLVGQIPFPFESIYSATKFALEGMVNSLAYEIEPFGLKASIVQPAQVSTNFAAKIHKLPPEGSPYRDRIGRFIERDNELIKTAPNPVQAAEKIARVITDPQPKRYYQVDFMSSFFLFLNRLLPRGLRDAILLNHMKIKEPRHV